MRLQVFLAKAGICSRRNAEKLMSDAKISVNGKIVTTLGTKINPKTDVVMYQKTLCKIKEEYKYFLFNKPVRVESTNSTHSNFATTREYIVPYYKNHIFCKGRLDFMSSGLMIYTTDGNLTHKFTHPRYNVKKVYEVTSPDCIPEHFLKMWKRGVTIDNIRYTLQDYVLHKTLGAAKLTLCEGKNREIRSVFTHYNVPIKTLHRTNIGPFSLMCPHGLLKVGMVQSAPALMVQNALKMIV